jgi:hypothetical protein
MREAIITKKKFKWGMVVKEYNANILKFTE